MGELEEEEQESGGPEAWSAERVGALRYRLGLSQQELARRLGVRQQTVSDWETGRHAPRGASKRVLRMVAEEPAEYTASPPPKRSRRGRRASESGP